MICPMKFNSETIDGIGRIKEDACECELERCGWYEQQSGTCGIQTVGYLKTWELERGARGVRK